jgi:small-conductance mechanosensitive channel
MLIALDAVGEAGDVALIAAIFVVGWAAAWSLRPGLRWAFRALARRGLNGKATRWRLRVPRVLGESIEVAELRRSQRIESTAAMVARLLSVLVWVLIAVLVLGQVGIEPAVALSGAGFLGIALAFGGQGSVEDFLSGLHILWEDRLGEGDDIQLVVEDQAMTGTVTWVGAFSTRFDTDLATVHVANRNLAIVVNLSQRGVRDELRYDLPDAPQPHRATLEVRLRRCYAATPGHDPSRDGLVIDRVESRDAEVVVIVRTARPLSADQHGALSACTTAV